MFLYILLFVIIIYIAVACERAYWVRIIGEVREYIDPVVQEFNLGRIPVTPRFWNAVTYDKSRITMCVRRYYNVPQLAYVLLHEYAHVLTVSIGHTDEFWAWFDRLLLAAKQKHIYIDEYFKNHSYCRV